MADEYISREAALKAILVKEDREIKSDYDFSRGLIAATNAVHDIPATDVAPRCPHYIRNIHDRGDDSLCEKWGCEVKEVAPVRHGRWKRYRPRQPLPINGSRSTYFVACEDWFRCSECGVGFEAKTFYCPNCGCRMDLEAGE